MRCAASANTGFHSSTSPVFGSDFSAAVEALSSTNPVAGALRMPPATRGTSWCLETQAVSVCQNSGIFCATYFETPQRSRTIGSASFSARPVLNVLSGLPEWMPLVVIVVAGITHMTMAVGQFQKMTAWCVTFTTSWKGSGSTGAPWPTFYKRDDAHLRDVWRKLSGQQ